MDDGKASIAIMLQKHPAPWRIVYFGSGTSRGYAIKDALSKVVVGCHGFNDGVFPSKDAARGIVALVNERI